MTDQYSNKITAIIPTYNEASNLSKLVYQLFELTLPNFGILIIDDNSPDKTAKVAENLSSQYGGKIEIIVRPQKAGLGTAYKQGFAHAVKSGSKHLIQLDADLSHPISEIPIMLVPSESRTTRRDTSPPVLVELRLNIPLDDAEQPLDEHAVSVPLSFAERAYNVDPC